MKALLQSIIPVLLCATAGALPALRFSNGDTFTGTPRSIGVDKLVWESPLLEKPAEFFTNKIVELALAPSHPQERPDHEALVTLTNGDSIRGQLSSITDEAVTLDTWFAGRLKLNRLMVSGVKIEESSAAIYAGPTGLEGWIQSADPPAWTYSQSSFRSTLVGGIAREDLLTEQCSVKFDIAWKGDSIRLRVVLFSDDPKTDNPDNGFDLTFQRGRVHLRNAGTQNFLGSAQSRALMEDDHASVEIRASAKDNRVALLIDDEVVEVWNDPDAGGPMKGRTLQFISSANMPMKLSNIRVTEWDGVMDRMPDPQVGFNRFGFGGMPQEPPAKPKEKDKDRMELANGDTLPGEVKSITDGIITLNTPLGEIKLPVGRLRSVALKTVDTERCKRYNGDVRAWFPDGTSIVFRLENSDGETFNGYSQNFGNATFKASAFTRIEFDIHSTTYQQRAIADNW